MHPAPGTSPAPRTELPGTLAAIAVTPGDAGYEEARHSYLRRGSPAVVLRVRDSHDVAAALSHVAATGARLSLRSGGHGISGRSTNHGGVVVDLTELSEVRVLDTATGLVRVGAGARWGDVARTLAPHGLALSSGDTGDVGVGGLATAGGIGLMSRMHGLTIDHVKAVDLVRADGELVRADAEHYPDLFWAMRGAGANFGVATAFEFQAQQASDVIEAVTTYDATDTAGLLVRWGRTMEAAPRSLTSFLTLVPAGGRIIGRAVSVYASPDHSAARAALKPLLAVAPALGHQTTLTPYHRLVPATHTPHYGQQKLSVVHSALFDHIGEGLGEAVGAIVASGQVMAQFRSVGGAVNDVPRSHTAYAHRTQNFSLMAATTPESEYVLDRRWADVRPYMNGLYLSFETGTSSDFLHAAFPGTTLDRLRMLKDRYDPAGILADNFPINGAHSAR